MKKFYSNSTNGFYAEEIHGTDIPADAVEISTQEYRELIDGQSQGKRIVSNASGFPVLADRPTPSWEDLRDEVLTEVRIVRRPPVMSILDGMQTSALTNSDLAGAQVIEAAKTGLKNITKVDLSACTTAEEMRQAIMAAYLAIASAVPPAVQLAFAQVVA